MYLVYYASTYRGDVAKGRLIIHRRSPDEIRVMSHARSVGVDRGAALCG